MRAVKSNEKGGAAVEFALVLPMLFLVLFAIIEYGWLLTNQIVLTNAVSEGARAGIKAGEWNDDAEICDYAEAAVKSAFWPAALNEADVKAEIKSDPNGFRRMEVEVANMTYKPITGYIPSSLMPDHLAAKAVMIFP